MDFTVYDALGKILRTGECPEDMVPLQAQPEEAVVGLASHQDTQYVLQGAVLDRPDNPATLVGTALFNLPVPCQITVNGLAFDCDQASATLTLPPGEYALQVTAWPYLDANFTVRV